MTAMTTPLLKRVLVIDDDQAVLQDYRRVLAPAARSKLSDAAASFFGAEGSPRRIAPAPTPAAIEVECSEQGVAGVAAVRAARERGRPFDVVFVDMRMPPGIDGRETIRRIRDVDPGLPCIVCTAFSDVDTNALRGEFGEALAVLHKPFDPSQIRRIVEAARRDAA